MPAFRVPFNIRIIPNCHQTAFEMQLMGIVLSKCFFAEVLIVVQAVCSCVGEVLVLQQLYGVVRIDVHEMRRR